MNTIAPEDMLDELLKASREIGNVQGHACAYREVVKRIDERIASAEDELTRSPHSDLVMGEIMALKRLAQDMADAPEAFETRANQYAERFDLFVKTMREVVKEALRAQD
jgi:hypothetical protein